MALDAYAVCPCGSGKKLKFCCQPIIGEMEKVERLIHANQNRQALKALESLDGKDPGNPWVGVHRAAILMGEGLHGDAVEILTPLIEQHPDHVHAISLLAGAAFSAKGFKAAKPLIHRAFLRCGDAFPDTIGNLALGIAASMYATQKYMAARQHLTLAMRLVSDEQKQDIFVRLLEFDGNRGLPYPIRSVHDLVKVEGDAELTKQASKARRLSEIGCWRPAAKIYSNLAEKHPDQAGLWQNAALCRAWDGDELQAAKNFHKAAELTDDAEEAVELETLAQLLDYSTTEDVIRFTSRDFAVTSVGQLLTKLDENAKIVRLEKPQPTEDGAIPPAAIFQIVDREELLESSDAAMTLDNIANVIAQVVIYDGDPDRSEDGPGAYLSGKEGESLDAACRCFLECGGELVSEKDPDEEPLNETTPRELQYLTWSWQLPDGTPVHIRRELEFAKWRQATVENWIDGPLACLNGKTPKDAAGDDDSSVPLTAALAVLDSYCDRSGHNLAIEELRERLSLKPPQPLEITPETSLSNFTVTQLQRLPVEDLGDEQLSSALNRAILIHHGRFLKRVLLETLKRPECIERIDINRVHMTLFDLCMKQGARDEALDWASRAVEAAESLEKTFEISLQWTIRELSVRVENPADEAIAPLLEKLDSYYLPKVPDLRAAIDELLAQNNIEPPWQGRPELAGVHAGDETGAVSKGGIWTPGDADEPAASGKKLWTPGQD